MRYVVFFSLLVGFTFAVVAQENPSLKLFRSDSTISIINGAKDTLLSYRLTVKTPPDGVDTIFGRGGYIHPLKTIAGHVLTRIQPADHYHHYGLWNPWTRMEYQGKVYDLWNLGDRQGTVRHMGLSGLMEGENEVGFTAWLQHVAFTAEGREAVLLNEDWEISIRPIDSVCYIMDLNSTLSHPGQDTVVLKAYRYAGLGFRATEQWTNKNSTMLTSSGKKRSEADGATEKWILVQGQLNRSQGGVLFLSYPKNYNHPEPIRVWPETEMQNRGDVFVNISPTKNKDWVLLPQQQYRLKYRLIVFDGEMDAERANRYWNSFAQEDLLSN